MNRAKFSDRTLLGLLLICVAVAGWPSMSGLLALADGDTPVSFVPLIPLLGAVLLIWRCDGPAIRERAHDGFLDNLVAGVFLLVTIALLLVLPVVMSWDFWLDRIDVPGLILLLSTLVVVFWGLPGLVQLGPGLLFLLFAWPFPYVLFYGHIIPGMTAATAAAARLVAPLMPVLNIRPDSTHTDSLLIPFHGHSTLLVVAQSCAGVNGLLGLVVVGLPIAMIGRGSWESRGLWLLTGAALSWVVNVVRIVIIAWAAAIWGPDPVMQLLHPELGLVLFAVSFALLLLIAPWFKLDILGPWREERPRQAGPGQPWPAYRLLLGAVILASAGIFESNFGQFGWVTESSLPRIGQVNASDLIKAPPGWRLGRARPVAWQPLFGSSSVSSISAAVAPSRGRIDIQAVLAADASSLTAYGVEDCYTFHGFDLRAIHRVGLGNGVTATLIDFKADSQEVAALYWMQPVQTPRGLYHERIVLTANAALARVMAGQAPVQHASASSANPVQALATALDEMFSPWFGGSAGPDFSVANSTLTGFAQAVIARERYGK